MSDAGTVDLAASPFVHRLGTNYGATDDEVKQLQELLAAPTAELDALQEEMDRLSERLDELSRRRKALACTVDAHRALMSPIRRMPVDIIQEIFLLCLPNENNPVMSRHECPMLLTQICSSWRHVAHSTPLLWSAIHVVIPPQSPVHYLTPTTPWEQMASRPCSAIEVARNRAAGIHQWFTRGGECPLDIVVYDRDMGNSDSAYDIILTAILSFSRRWETIRLDSSSRCLSKVAALSEHDVPILRSLTIRGAIVIDPVNPDDILDFSLYQGAGILNAPQLRQIEYTWVTEDFHRFPLKWDQLTVITLRDIAWNMSESLSLARVVQILRRCPALIRGAFEICSTTQPIDLVGAHNSQLAIRHLALEFLSLSISGDDLQMLLPVLDTPALRKFEVFLGGPPSNITPPEVVISFLQRVSPTLQSLTMDSMLLGKKSLHRCLRMVPGLTSLSIRPSYFRRTTIFVPTDLAEDQWPSRAVDDDLLKAFTDDLNPLLEMLESFESDNAFSDTPITDEALVSFIRAKRSQTVPARLKKVAVTFQRPRTLSMVNELRQYVKEGLDCRLSYMIPTPQPAYPASDGTVVHGPLYRTWGVLSFDDADTASIPSD